MWLYTLLAVRAGGVPQMLLAPAAIRLIEALTEALRVFYANLEKLRAMEAPELLLQGRVKQYQSILEDAFAAYGKVETTIDEFGQELEYEHVRLDNAVKQYGEA